MIYLICYLSSCALAYLNFYFRKSNKYFASIFTFFAIFIPCFLAGIRDPQIGTDVNVYVKPVIDTMRSSGKDLFSLLYSELFVGETNGVFFTALLYFCSKFTNGLFIALFLIEFFCLFPVYKVIQKQDFSSILKVLSLFCYFCFFYHLGLNLMKQCIAISITFLGFELLKEHKNRRYILLVLVTALLVHKSAFIALLVYVVFVLTTDKREMLVNKYSKIRIRLEKKSDRRKKNFMFFLLLLVAICVLLNIRSLLLILVTLKHSYIYQLSHMKSFELKYSNFLVMILLLLPVVLFRRKILKADCKYRFYTFIIILSALLYQFVGVSPALYRISLYTLIFLILAVPNYINLFNKDEKIIAGAYYLAISVINFVFEVILNSYAGVYPYTTGFLAE